MVGHAARTGEGQRHQMHRSRTETLAYNWPTVTSTLGCRVTRKVVSPAQQWFEGSWGFGPVGPVLGWVGLVDV